MRKLKVLKVVGVQRQEKDAFCVSCKACYFSTTPFPLHSKDDF
jgi:hypothetical protein